jgi:putative ABC transport system substrate-binding protein
MAIHIRRREFFITLGGAATWRALLLRLSLLGTLTRLALAASAQQAPNKLPRLGWLGNGSPTFPPYEGLRQGLRELGYVEGRNIAIETRWAGGDLDRLPALARELVGLSVDLLFVAGDQGLKAAKDTNATIPIVVAACDPLDSLVASIARPGGKATGLTCISSDLAGKRLQLLQELVPTLSRVAILYNPTDRNKAPEYKQMQDAARSMQLMLRAVEARSADEIDAAFVEMANRAQGLIALADPLMNAHVKKLADLALKNRLPAVYGFREFADAGGLMSYGASLHWLFWRAASYVDRIIKGANPGDLPIEQPTKFELVINLKTAKALGLIVPDKLLALADEVIE